MEYLLIIMIIMSAVSSFGSSKVPDPKFYKGQRVKYQPIYFLHKVCSGKGTIEDVSEYSKKGYFYRISPPTYEPDCPDTLDKPENEIKDRENEQE